MPLFTMRCSLEELEVLRRDAAAHGESMSEFVRRAVFGPPRAVPVSPAREAVVERVAAEVVEKVRAQHVAPKPGHVHKAQAAGPVARCVCGVVRGVDGVWR